MPGVASLQYGCAGLAAVWRHRCTAVSQPRSFPQSPPPPHPTHPPPTHTHNPGLQNSFHTLGPLLGLQPRDLLLHSDVDEIPTAAGLQQAANLLWNGLASTNTSVQVPAVNFDMKMYYYNLHISLVRARTFAARERQGGAGAVPWYRAEHPSAVLPPGLVSRRLAMGHAWTQGERGFCSTTRCAPAACRRSGCLTCRHSPAAPSA